METQGNLSIIWMFLGIVLFFVCLILAHALYQTLQQIRNTAKTIDKTIEENQELFENLRKVSKQLNEQLTELEPVIEQLKETAAKINNFRQNLLSIVGLISTIAGNRLGRLPAYIAGVSWIYKKFKKGGKQ